MNCVTYVYEVYQPVVVPEKNIYIYFGVAPDEFFSSF